MSVKVWSVLAMCLVPSISCGSDKDTTGPMQPSGLASPLSSVFPPPSISTVLKAMPNMGNMQCLSNDADSPKKRKGENTPPDLEWVWGTLNHAQTPSIIRLATDKAQGFAGEPALDMVYKACSAVHDQASYIKFLEQFFSLAPNNPFDALIPEDERTNPYKKIKRIGALGLGSAAVAINTGTTPTPFDAAYQHLDQKLTFIHRLVTSGDSLPLQIQHDGFSCTIDQNAACTLRLAGSQQYPIFPTALYNLRPYLKQLFIISSGMALSPLTLDPWDRLELLVLSNNLLQHVTLRNLPKLKECRLPQNQLMTLELGTAEVPLQALTELNLSNNKLSDLPALPPNLTTLLIANNLLKLTNLHPLRLCTQLKILDLSANPLSPLAPKQTAIELPKLLPASLTSLGIASLDLRSTPDLTRHTSLRHLSLNENPLQKVSHETLPTTSLVILQLNSTIIPVNIDLTKCENLVEVSLTHRYNLRMISSIKVPPHPLTVYLSAGYADNVKAFDLPPATKVKIAPCASK